MADAPQPAALDLSGIPALGPAQPTAAPVAAPAPTAPTPQAQPAQPALDLSSAPAETPQQTLTRLEPSITDPKLSDADRQAAQDAWRAAYINDVTQNGPLARAKRFVSQISPNGMVKAAEGAAQSANNGILAAVRQPLTGIPAVVNGAATSVGDIAKGALDLGGGLAEQGYAALAPYSKAAAGLAADSALLRARADAAYSRGTQAIADSSGNPQAFGAGRTAGQVASALIAPESVSGDSSALAGASNAAGQAAKAVTKGTIALASAPATVPLKVGRMILADAPVAGPLIKGAGSLGSGLSSLATDGDSLIQASKNAVDTAKSTFQVAQQAGADPAHIAELAANARDAQVYHSVLSAGVKTLKTAQNHPGLGDAVAAVVNRGVAPAVIGGSAGVLQQGLTATAGDPNAASAGAAGGAGLGVFARNSLNLQSKLAELGEARLKAEQQVASTLPKTLPANDTAIGPQVAKATADELQGTQSAPNPFGSKPSGTPLAAPSPSGEILSKPTDGQMEIKFTPGEEGLPEVIPSAKSVQEVAGTQVPVKDGTMPAPINVPAATAVAEPSPVESAPTPAAAPATAPTSAPDSQPLARPSSDRPESPLPGTAPKRNFVRFKTPIEFDPRILTPTPENIPANDTMYALPGAHAPVTSSNMQSVGYLPDKQLLSIRFKDNSHYIHPNVPPELHQQLMSADSQGRFYNQNIKGKFPYLVVDTNLFKNAP